MLIKYLSLLLVWLSLSSSGMILLLHAGKRKPQLVLLDHGLYKELDFTMRTSYAALWKVNECSDILCHQFQIMLFVYSWIHVLIYDILL